MADKTAAMGRLEQYGLKTPVSLVVTKSSGDNLHAFVGAHGHVTSWYLRFNERLAPWLPKVVNSPDLLNLVPAVVRTTENLTVIVQERVVAHVSGAMAVRPDLIFVEYVAGEPVAMLRNGVTPSRILFLPDGKTLCVERNKQEFSCFWKSGLLKHGFDISLSHLLSEKTRHQLCAAAKKVGSNGIMEWIQMDDGNVVFLDHRPMSSEFLIGLENLTLGFDAGCYQTLSEDSTRSPSVSHLERPLYEYAETVSPNMTSLTFEAGAVLAHACVYATEQGVRCVVSRPKTDNDGETKVKMKY